MDFNPNRQIEFSGDFFFQITLQNYEKKMGSRFSLSFLQVENATLKLRKIIFSIQNQLQNELIPFFPNIYRLFILVLKQN